MAKTKLSNLSEHSRLTTIMLRVLISPYFLLSIFLLLFIYFLLTPFPAGVSIYRLLEAGKHLDLIDILYEIGARLSSPDEPLNSRNLIIGIIAYIGLFLTGFRSLISERQARVSEKNYLDDSFMKASQLLSNDLNETSYPTHLAGIAQLKNLAINSSEHTQSCIDAICGSNEWMNDYRDKFKIYPTGKSYASWRLTPKNKIVGKKNSAITLLHEKRSQESLKAITYILRALTVEDKRDSLIKSTLLLFGAYYERPLLRSAIIYIFRRILLIDYKQPLEELDFTDKMLCGICLSNLDARYSKLNLSNANLQSADFHNAKLQGANLSYSDLQKANLNKANLQYADMSFTNLRGATLFGAKRYKNNLIHDVQTQKGKPRNNK